MQKPSTQYHFFPAIVFFILLSACSLQAQRTDLINGYYISTKGESHSGQIYVGSFRDRTLRFRASENSNWVDLSPLEVKEVHGKDGYFITTQPFLFKDDTARIFVHRILNGGYSLFEGGNSQQGRLFYINSKEKQNLVKINPLGLQTQLQVYMGTCAASSKRKVRYNESSLILYISEMNDCAYPASQVTNNVRPLSPKLELGANIFFFRMNASDIVPSLLDASFKPTNQLGIGLKAGFNLTPALTITAGVNYINKRFVSDSLNGEFVIRTQTVNPNTGAPFIAHTIFYHRYILDLRLKYLEVPLGLRLRIKPYLKTSFVLAGGLCLQFPLDVRFAKSFGTPYKMQSDPQVSYTLEDGTRSIYNTSSQAVNIGIYGGVGFRRKLHKKNEIEVMLQYFWNKEKIKGTITGNEEYGYRISSSMATPRIQLSVGYNFQVGKAQ